MTNTHYRQPDPHPTRRQPCLHPTCQAPLKWPAFFCGRECRMFYDLLQWVAHV